MKCVYLTCCLIAAILLASASTAQALVMPNAWYTYMAPGGWTYAAPANSRYNCEAYALGYTDRWCWPAWAGLYVTESEMDVEMAVYGRIRASSSTAKMIAYGYAGDVRHFGKVTSGTQTVAKWGALERFSHRWFPYREKQSEAITYGGLRRYYK